MRKANSARPTSWIGYIVDPADSWVVAGALSLAYATLTFLVALIVAATHGFGHAFVHTPQVWLLAAETAWVFFFGAWSTRSLRALPDQVRPALSLSDVSPSEPARHLARPLRRLFERWLWLDLAPEDRGRYDQYSNAWRKRVFSPWFCLSLGVALDVVLAVWFYEGQSWRDYFGQHWLTTTHADLHATLVLLLVAPCGPLIITMLWGFSWYFVFVRSALVKNDLIPMPDVAADELRPVTTFGLVTGFGWSVAVALGVWFFQRKLVWPDELLLAALGAMGLMLIIGPQLIAHDALVRTRSALLRETAAGLPGVQPAEWLARNVDSDASGHRRREFLKELREVPVWIYSPTQALVLAAEVAIPVVSLVLKRGG